LNVTEGREVKEPSGVDGHSKTGFPLRGSVSKLGYTAAKHRLRDIREETGARTSPLKAIMNKGTRRINDRSAEALRKAGGWGNRTQEGMLP